MDVTGTKDAKQRVMHATVELLREGGLRAAAPAAIADRAGAGKMSLYRHFGSKDELIAEALRDNGERSREWILGSIDDGDPRERVLAIFDRIAERAERGALRPCVYMMTRMEVPDEDHPAVPVTIEYKRHVVATLTAWLREMHHPEPEMLAQTISMLVDGCITRAVMIADARPVRDARRAVEVLLEM
ncbi:MAG TPA: TetR/AcrR family transcriptional regulator [Pseudonocardiaceae bacterium]